jgi:hypothetical protein
MDGWMNRSAPDTLVEGLDELFRRIKAQSSGAGARPGDGNDDYNSNVHDTEQIKGLVSKNKELFARLQSSEDHKTKAMMRLMTFIASPTPSQSTTSTATGDTATPLAITDGSGVDKVSTSDGTLALVSSNTLQLSDNGVEDREISLLVTSLAQNTSLTELDLRGNRITNHGLLSLVIACVSPSCQVRSIDLQQNRINLDGLQSLASSLLGHTTTRTATSSSGNAHDTATHDKDTSNNNETKNDTNAPSGDTDGSGNRNEAVNSHDKTAASLPLPAGTDIVWARLRTEAKVLLPVLDIELRIPPHDPATGSSSSSALIVAGSGTRRLVVDLRYNRLQHSYSYPNGISRGRMKKMLTSITRTLDQIGSHNGTTMTPYIAVEEAEVTDTADGAFLTEATDDKTPAGNFSHILLLFV